MDPVTVIVAALAAGAAAGGQDAAKDTMTTYHAPGREPSP